MRRSLIGRCAAFLLALAFPASATGDALGAHPCPHHDAVPAAHAADAPLPAGDAHHAGHDADAADHDDGGSPCTCPGECSVSDGVAHPAIDDHAAPLAGNDARESGRAAAPTLRAATSDYLLPFANAPPSSR